MVGLNIPYGEKMKNMLKRVKEGYKYFSAQDIHLWRNLLFLLKYPKIVYRFIFVKNSGSDFLEAQPVDPSDLCRDVSRAIGIDEGELGEYHKEFESDSRFHQSIEKKLGPVTIWGTKNLTEQSSNTGEESPVRDIRCCRLYRH